MCKIKLLIGWKYQSYQNEIKMHLIEVTKEAFYNYVRPKNLTCCVLGVEFPYTTVFRNKINGGIEAKIEPVGKCVGITSDPYKYYIRKKW